MSLCMSVSQILLSCLTFSQEDIAAGGTPSPEDLGAFAEPTKDQGGTVRLKQLC